MKKIYLVHNGSEARHVEVLRAEFPDIEHLVLEANRGYSGGVNAGLEHAFRLHEWVILLTNDSKLLSLPQIPEKPALVAPVIYRKETERVDSFGAGFIPGKGRLYHCRSKSDFETAKADSRQQVYVPGTAFLVHRDLVESVGLLSEELHMFWDDVEWSLRVQESGFPVLLDETWSIAHGLGKTAHSLSLYTLYYFQRNRKWLSWRYASRPSEKLSLSLYLLRDWARLAWRLGRSGRWGDLQLLWKVIRH